MGDELVDHRFEIQESASRTTAQLCFVDSPQEENLLEVAMGSLAEIVGMPISSSRSRTGVSSESTVRLCTIHYNSNAIQKEKICSDNLR